MSTATPISAAQGISKNLVQRAFPENERPDYLTSDDFYRFTPTEEFMSLPGDIARTEFRLVAAHEGWEYTILERELGAHRDPERKMLVTVRSGALPLPLFTPTTPQMKLVDRELTSTLLLLFLSLALLALSFLLFFFLPQYCLFRFLFTSFLSATEN